MYLDAVESERTGGEQVKGGSKMSCFQLFVFQLIL